MIAAPKTTAHTARTIAIGIHSGERTHHQDQVIVPISFRMIKTMARRPTNPIPPLEELDDVLINYSSLIFRISIIDGLKTMATSLPPSTVILTS